MYARFGLDVISHKIKLAKWVGILTCLELFIITLISFLLEFDHFNEFFKNSIENNIFLYIIIFSITTILLIILPEFKNFLIYLVILLWII